MEVVWLWQYDPDIHFVHQMNSYSWDYVTND